MAARAPTGRRPRWWQGRGAGSKLGPGRGRMPYLGMAMNSPSRRQHITEAATALLGSARFGRAISISIVATAYLAFVLKSTMGWAGLIGIVAAEVILAAVSLAIRREELEWRGLLPISLLAFIGWSALSVFWTDYQWAALGSVILTTWRSSHSTSVVRSVGSMRRVSLPSASKSCFEIRPAGAVTVVRRATRSYA